MPTLTIEARHLVAADSAAVFAWHERPGAFERLTPPWQAFRLLERTGGLEDGARATFEVRFGPFRQRWTHEHFGYEPGVQFSDRQTAGPFRRWEHIHRIEPAGDGSSAVIDQVTIEAPPIYAPLGPRIARDLHRMFAYRARTIAGDLAALARHSERPRLRIAVTGASGLVGRALLPYLTCAGHTVVPIVRGPARAGTIGWDPVAGNIDLAALEGLDAVIHLAGESIAALRWSEAKKQRIVASRLAGTRLLASALAGLRDRPRVLVSASASGYYGDRGEELLDESAAAGTGFLADLAQGWEAACDPAREAGIRVVHPRLGVVLSPAGGFLARLLPLFRAGGGGLVGSGRQYLPWIGIDDLLDALAECLHNEALEGPVNAVAPAPATNRGLTIALGRAVHRPTVVPLPAAVARVVMGEVADELLLPSTRMAPARLTAAGMPFRHADLESALAHLLGRAK